MANEMTSMFLSEAELHDRDADDLGDVDNCWCAACGADGNTVHPFDNNRTVSFERNSKCEWCHGVHLYCYGEMTWKDFLLQDVLTLNDRENDGPRQKVDERMPIR